MSDALLDAARNISSDRSRKLACSLVLEQTVVQVREALAEGCRLSGETKRLLDLGDKDAARVAALEARDAILKSRRIMKTNIALAVSLLQGEDRRKTRLMFGTLYDRLCAAA